MQESRPTGAWWDRIEQPGGVLLRRLAAHDAPGVLAVHGDPRVYVHDPHETHPDLAHTRRFLAPMLEHWTEPRLRLLGRAPARLGLARQ